MILSIHLTYSIMFTQAQNLSITYHWVSLSIHCTMLLMCNLCRNLLECFIIINTNRATSTTLNAGRATGCTILAFSNFSYSTAPTAGRLARALLLEIMSHAYLRELSIHEIPLCVLEYEDCMLRNLIVICLSNYHR